jgi:hypothetical protein
MGGLEVSWGHLIAVFWALIALGALLLLVMIFLQGRTPAVQPPNSSVRVPMPPPVDASVPDEVERLPINHLRRPAVRITVEQEHEECFLRVENIGFSPVEIRASIRLAAGTISGISRLNHLAGYWNGDGGAVRIDPGESARMRFWKRLEGGYALVHWVEGVGVVESRAFAEARVAVRFNSAPRLQGGGTPYQEFLLTPDGARPVRGFWGQTAR